MKDYYHFIGIGGIGMSGLARLFLKSGFKVSGSDLKENKITDELKGLGAQIFIGHNKNNLSCQNRVVYSSAIKDDNPEMLRAKELGMVLLKRAQSLAELMRGKAAITIAGSHGKTTTTSLVSCMLLEAGLSPTVAIGGILNNISTNACLGDGEFFVAEADESDGSFLYYQPKYSIITNIDHEHLDYYLNFENEIKAFNEYILKTEKSGCVFACFDDPILRKLLTQSSVRHKFFGLGIDADITARNLEFDGLNSKFDCFVAGKLLGKFNLALGGRHNISNALAVIALGLELGIENKFIKQAFQHYKGAGRRLEVKFQDNDFLVLDDYAHHPTEIRATISAIKDLKAKRTIGIFQPHRYSRTKLLLDDFTGCFSGLDKIIITDVYAASEKPIEGVSGKLLFEKIKKHFPDKDAVFLPKQEILKYLLSIISSGDLLITLGAGDIVRLSDELSVALAKKN